MGTYSIRDLERLTQVKAHTIRIWEKRYGILRPRRSDTNIRAYSDDDLRKLLNVSLLNDRGLKISRIARLSESEIRAKVLELGAKPGGPADEVENLVLAMMELDAERFEKVISNCVLRLGFERTMYEVLVPFLHRAGILWQTGTVKPGQEHFASNLVRQKLIAAIDALVPPARADRKTVLLFLPEGELHELGLLFSTYIIRKAGHRTIYLGQSVPFSDLVAVADRHLPDLLVTAFLTIGSPEMIAGYLNELASKVPGATILAHSGDAGPKGTLDPRVHLLNDLASLNSWLG